MSAPSKVEKEKPWFQVTRYSRMFMGSIACQITVDCDKYWIVRLAGKSTVRFRIVDVNGDIVAEVSLASLFNCYIRIYQCIFYHYN